MYKEISKYYNKIFPLNEEKINFIKRNSRSEYTRILDIGCATGELAIELTNLGYIVTGIDIDQEMITTANRFAKEAKMNVKFIVGDMLELTNYFSKNDFDFIICWGNTIAHLRDSLELKKFINECFKVLRGDGKLSIQFINFNKIIKSQIFFLPEIDNQDIKFKRYYSFNQDGKLIFNTEITIKETEETFKQNTFHYPINKKELLGILIEAGFNNFELFSDFKGKIFEEDDLSIILNATKI